MCATSRKTIRRKSSGDHSIGRFRPAPSHPRSTIGRSFPRSPDARTPRHINTTMTTQREMELSHDRQQEVIATLYEIGDPDLAVRLERCMTARLERHYGDGWPYSCRSSTCFWCRRAMIRGWWFGMREWSSATTSSLALIPILSPAGLLDAILRLRRGLRDVRDRTARRWRQWRTVSFAGLMGIDRREVVNVLRRRWPDVMVKELQQEEPTWEITADDAADLGSHRRGVEPLRIVVMPQKVRRVTVAHVPVMVEPMPVVI